MQVMILRKGKPRRPAGEPTKIVTYVITFET